MLFFKNFNMRYINIRTIKETGMSVIRSCINKIRSNECINCILPPTATTRSTATATATSSPNVVNRYETSPNTVNRYETNRRFEINKLKMLNELKKGSIMHSDHSEINMATDNYVII